MSTIKQIKIGDQTHIMTPAYGVCGTAAATAAKTVTINGFELIEGAVVIIKFTYSNSASNPTLNVNGTGAKPMYHYGTTVLSTGTTTTGWQAGSVQVFVYDGTGWIRDYWNNTTYSNAEMGQGYGVCNTNASVSLKTVTIENYDISDIGGIISIRFINSVPAGASLSISSKASKPIYYRGSAITADIIKSNDLATFIYDGSSYHLLSIDRWQEDIYSHITDDSKHIVYEHPSTHPISMIDGLQTALAEKAPVNHEHSLSDFNSGTLDPNKLPITPIEKGGTGATTVAGAVANLGLSNVLIVESFDVETGILRTRSYDYTG